MQYSEVLSKVMSEDVTLEDWKKFRAYHEKHSVGKNPTGEEFKRWKEEFVKAAHHVVSVLSKDNISQDIVLVLAYEELNHPEKFA